MTWTQEQRMWCQEVCKTFLEKGFAESFQRACGILRHEWAVSLHGPAVNLSLFQTLTFFFFVWPLCIGHMDFWYYFLLFKSSYLTLFGTLWTGSLPGSSVHRISQARILEWVAISFCRGSSRPRNWTLVSSLQVDPFPLSYLGSPMGIIKQMWGGPLRFDTVSGLWLPIVTLHQPCHCNSSSWVPYLPPHTVHA